MRGGFGFKLHAVTGWLFKAKNSYVGILNEAKKDAQRHTNQTYNVNRFVADHRSESQVNRRGPASWRL